MRLLLVVALSLLPASVAVPAPAAAWGNSAHKAICETAVRLLTANAREAFDRILGAARANFSRSGARLSGTRQKPGLGEACTHPDRIAEREMEHHSYYARTAASVDGPGCGLRPACVTSAIDLDLAALRSPTLADRERGVALASLGHWVGDVHQPLHVAFADDLAGNLVDSSGLCHVGLHHAWDTCIFETEMLGGDRSDGAIAALADRWVSTLDPAAKAEWQRTPSWRWAAESFDIARQPWLGYCVRSADGCRYSEARLAWAAPGPRRVQAVDEAYVRQARPVIKRRMVQAGVRLAHLLNRALDPGYERGHAGKAEKRPDSRRSR